MVVGFDAMDHNLAREFAEQGHMPTYARLLGEAQHAPINNPVGFVVGGVWPSFWSGRWPGAHGRHCYVQLIPGTYEFVTVYPDTIDGVPFWQKIGERGFRVGNFDVPFSDPIEGLDGLQIIDWGSHDRVLPFQTMPVEEAASLEAAFGSHPIEPRCDSFARAGQWEELRDGLLAGCATRTDMALDRHHRDDYDLICVVYGESHCAGHQFWFIHDRDYVDHDPTLRGALGDPLVDVYASLDRQLGRLLEAVPDALTYVLLSHGFGPHHDGDHLLAEILGRLDSSDQTSGIREMADRTLHRAKSAIRPLVPYQRRRAHHARRKRRSDPTQASRDRARSRFFHHPNNTMYSGIRINLAGREPEGVVAPEEQEELIAWLSSELSALKEPQTGRGVVSGVIRVADVCEGPHLDELPDLLVDWDRSAPISDVTSPVIGRVTGKYASSRSGDHRLEGQVLVTGPGSEAFDLRSRVDLVDLAPTLAAHFGITLEAVDGRPLESAVGVTI